MVEGTEEVAHWTGPPGRPSAGSAEPKGSSVPEALRGGTARRGP